MTIEAKESFSSVAIIGAAGQVGGFFTENLSPVTLIEKVFRKPAGVAESPIQAMFEAVDSEAVIVATQNNSTAEVLAEIARYAKKPITLILPQNGVEVVSVAEKILGEARANFSLVRASLFNTVGRDENSLVYNLNKKRIALASIGEDQAESLQKAKNLFQMAGFEVKVIDDYISMEWTKLLSNLFGSSGTITGLSPEVLSDPQIYALENRANKDRFRILEKANIKIADLWGIGRLRWLARLGWLGEMPDPIGRKFREYVSEKFAHERNNQPPAAARQIAEGARQVEATRFYHRPFTRLAEKHDMEDPSDEAIFNILRRHERGGYEKVNFDLNSLSPAERRIFFLDVYDLETQEVFIKRASFLGIPYVRWAVERVYEWYADTFKILGKENLNAAVQTLRKGKSVLFTPNHRSHADHPTIIKALRKSLPFWMRWKYPVYVVAGMKFDKEEISGRFNRAYSHPIVGTLTKEDDEETKWKAQIVNVRAGKVIDKLLRRPCIFVVYLEGGRNKSEDLALQPPSLHSSWWVLKPQFGLIIPAVITGTETMLPPGQQKPQHANITIEFGEEINAEELRSEKRKKNPEEWDRYFSGERVLQKVAEMLPEDEREVFSGV